MMFSRSSNLTWQKWLLALPLLLVPCTILFYSRDVTFAAQAPTIVASTHSDNFLVFTSGCRIPKMDAFDSTIRKYLRTIERVRCSPIDPLVRSNQTSLWIDEEVLKTYNVDPNDLRCCYYPFWRKIVKKGEKIKGKPDHHIVGEAKCYNFTHSINVQHEFVRVECTVTQKTAYMDFHAFVVPKMPKINQPKNKSKKPSVLIIGIDAVSRLNFYRQMPRTLHFLQVNQAVEFLGYNKVQDNTFPNLIPVLTGSTVEEIRRTCWRKEDSYFDNCPYLWKNYSENGFLTAFGEDTPWMGLFLYLKNGFLQPPVDYYLQPFMKNNEDSIGHHKDMNAKLCYGPRIATQVLLDYAEKFAVNLTSSKKPFFGFFWGTTLSHDYLNMPPDNDDIYVKLLQNLEQNGVYDNTVVIVMSDHGIRWGNIRQTYQGRVEERLPFMYILVPSRLKETYPYAYANLKRNTHMLTSPFDLHETLIDLVDVSRLEQDKLVERMSKLGQARGISWFLPVPENRTCSSAGITDEWCTCHESREINVEEEKVVEAAQAVVVHLNDKLFQYIQCAQLTLNKIVSARLEAPRQTVVSNSHKAIEDILLVIETVPGNGLFEVTVRYQYGAPNKVSVLGYVSRINTYGSQSRCVLDFHMRLYCYCI